MADGHSPPDLGVFQGIPLRMKAQDLQAAPTAPAYSESPTPVKTAQEWKQEWKQLDDKRVQGQERMIQKLDSILDILDQGVDRFNAM